MHGCSEWLSGDWVQMTFGKNGEVNPSVQESWAQAFPVQLGAVTSSRIGLELGLVPTWAGHGFQW